MSFDFEGDSPADVFDAKFNVATEGTGTFEYDHRTHLGVAMNYRATGFGAGTSRVGSLPLRWERRETASMAMTQRRRE